MISSIQSPTASCSRRWSLLCWGAALTLGVGWVIALLLHPEPSLLLPDSVPDTLLYTLFIQKAAAGFGYGDPFLWEYRDDPASLHSFFHFWPQMYGELYRLGGHSLLLAVSIFLSGLWFYTVFRFALRLGQARPYAFFMAGVQTFFIVNIAYQVCGFKTNFAAYTFWVTEHSRLYPTVTSMAFYNLAALGVLWALSRPEILKTILVAALVALTVYGRPFDWMVLLGALAILVVLAWLRRGAIVMRTTLLILFLAGLFSLFFVMAYFGYQKLHHNAYFDQIIRGNLHVKAPSHYLKYAALCIVLLGAVALAFWKSLLPRGKTMNWDADGGESTSLAWLSALATSSLLVHFKTAFEGGVTLVGFTYLMVFSVFPWFFMLAAHFVWSRLFVKHDLWFNSRVWVAALFILLTIQQIGSGLQRVSSHDDLEAERGRRRAYAWIRDHGVNNPVVLTLGSGLEAGVLAEAWIFFPNQLVATYTCSASTTELLNRFLLAKLLLTGTIRDLAPLFSAEGMPHVQPWIASQDAATRFWANLLQHSLGANAFIFHPDRNRGELRLRRIELPLALVNGDDFAAYFPSEFRNIFERCAALESSPCSLVLQNIVKQMRLDSVFVPNPSLSVVDVTRLETCNGLHEAHTLQPLGGRLWEVVSSTEADSTK
ncbi:MAG: hypothetical protein HY360_24785 [Verrucomicrobia bacterium]|nr:hypothetical protein [Verrucomicrobiota bacterium]